MLPNSCEKSAVNIRMTIEDNTGVDSKRGLGRKRGSGVPDRLAHYP